MNNYLVLIMPRVLKMAEGEEIEWNDARNILFDVTETFDQCIRLFPT